MPLPRIVILLIAALSTLTSSVLAAADNRKPNVLLISIDDLNDWVGCLDGHPQTRTPNVDRLAKQGVLFTQAYCPAPSCNPCRTATLTGIAPWRSGVYRNGQRWREVLPDAITLPQHFKQNGYYCAGGGKIFHHYQNDPASWHEYFPSIKNAFPPDPRAPKDRQPKFEKWEGYYREFTWGPQADDVGDENTGDYQSVQYVIKKLKALPTDRPFFLNCGIYRPHVPWFVPKAYFDRFPLKDVQLPEGFKDGLEDLSPRTQRRVKNSRYFNALDAAGLHEEATQGYLASINYMDAMVGLVLEALDASPHADNTIVVFWSDHGFHLGEKHWYRKYTLWDDSCHVPVIIRLPKSMAGYASGQRCDRAVSLIDLYPTLAELAGLPVGEHLDGQSLAPLLKEPTAARDRPVITVNDWADQYAVRTDRWCYIRRPDGEELYDQSADPHQTKNLAGVADHAATLKRLRGRLPANPTPATPLKPKAPAKPKQGAGQAKRKNVLFIAVDDLRPELGCYGNQHIQSPHIDQLARRGVTFTRAYCQQAVCNPSRASIMTGLRPDSTRVWDLVTHFRNTVPDVVTLPQHFRRHGYAALAFGKIYHNPLPDKHSWDEPNHWPRRARVWSQASLKRRAEYHAKMRAAGKPERLVRRMRAPATEDEDVPDSRRPDGEIADLALGAMGRLAGGEKPFFLAVGFINPHLPFNPPKKYWNLYDPSAIPLATDATPPRNAPAMAMNTMYELRDYLDFADTPRPLHAALTEAQQRRLKHGYYASVSFIDVQIGRLLKKLEELGLADDTVVVLWGDHGWKLGEHRSWCKQTNYEIDTRVPLIIRSPGKQATGRACDRLVELVDVYPTLCELAGLPLPTHLQGTSLAALLKDPTRPGKAAAFSQFRRRQAGNEYMGYAIRTQRYRYVEWIDLRTGKQVATELYDHHNDPAEGVNTAGEPKNAGLLSELSETMWSSIPRPTPLKPSRGPSANAR